MLEDIVMSSIVFSILGMSAPVSWQCLFSRWKIYTIHYTFVLYITFLT